MYRYEIGILFGIVVCIQSSHQINTACTGNQVKKGVLEKHWLDGHPEQREEFICTASNVSRLQYDSLYSTSMNTYRRVLVLDFSYNDLEEIKKVHFMRLAWLLVLRLKANRLTIIEKECFVDLMNLVKLDLSDNKLVIIQFNFGFLHHLTLLYVSGNERLGGLSRWAFQEYISYDALPLHYNSSSAQMAHDDSRQTQNVKSTSRTKPGGSRPNSARLFASSIRRSNVNSTKSSYRRHLAAGDVGFRCNCRSAWLATTRIVASISVTSKRRDQGWFASRPVCESGSKVERPVERNPAPILDSISVAGGGGDGGDGGEGLVGLRRGGKGGGGRGEVGGDFSSSHNDDIVSSLFEGVPLDECFLSSQRSVKCNQSMHKMAQQCGLVGSNFEYTLNTKDTLIIGLIIVMIVIFSYAIYIHAKCLNIQYKKQSKSNATLTNKSLKVRSSYTLSSALNVLQTKYSNKQSKIWKNPSQVKKLEKKSTKDKRQDLAEIEASDYFSIKSIAYE